MRNYVSRMALEHKLQGPVLDAGCGRRSNEPELSGSRLFDYYTLDRSRRLDPDFVADLEEPLPFSNGLFKTIICTEVLEHVQKPCLVIKNIFDILPPGGAFIVTAPFNKELHPGSDYGDYWRFSPSGMSILLSEFSYAEITASNEGRRPLAVYAIAWR